MRNTAHSQALLQALRENLKHIYEVNTTTNDHKPNDARTPGAEQLAGNQVQDTIGGVKPSLES
jgi:hypothetical protein